MRLERIIIKNIQLIKGLDIKLSPGLTVIVGRNETGKTAFVRAVETALLNCDAKDMVRDGERESEVEMRFESGAYFKWKREQKRSSATVSYDINGVPKTKMGRVVPEEITKIAIPWRIEGESFGFVQIHSQNDLPFLTTRISAKVGRAWDFLEGRTYRQAIDNCKSTLRKKNSEQSALIKSLNGYRDYIRPKMLELDECMIQIIKYKREILEIQCVLLLRKYAILKKLLRELTFYFKYCYYKKVQELREFDASESLDELVNLIGILKTRSAFEKDKKGLFQRRGDLKLIEGEIAERLTCPYFVKTGKCILLEALI